jgi:hypothetical protein
MGFFALAGAAMPLPPAQAEALYDLTLEDERAPTSNDRAGDTSGALLRPSLRMLVTPGLEPRLDRALQKARDESPAPASNADQTSA